jgi:plastocyanin
VIARTERLIMHSSHARTLAAAALCACLAGSLAAEDAPTTAPAITINISMKDFMFVPPSLTVKAGSTVTWTNLDQEPHTVVSTSGLFRSGALDTRESFSYRFAAPGTYSYFCTIHPRMVGTVVVE